MSRATIICAIQLVVAVFASGSVLPHAKPFQHLVDKRQYTATSSLQVDLGYEVYEGVGNDTLGLNIWKG